jgi:hypothetical protein
MMDDDMENEQEDTIEDYEVGATPLVPGGALTISGDKRTEPLRKKEKTKKPLFCHFCLLSYTVYVIFLRNFGK